MLNFNIHDDVRKFFLKNSNLVLIRDSNNSLYELPIAGYYGGYYKNISMVVVFGRGRESPFASFGPYYYFTSYEGAMNSSIWNPSRKPMEVDGELITNDEEGRYIRGGIVRFALFMGRTMMRRDATMERVSESLKETIRDTNTDWVYKYNSIMTHSCHKSQMVVKDYVQQIPLSYYYVNTEQNNEIAEIE